jgi:membrane protease YdiL (CAAX protease family)
MSSLAADFDFPAALAGGAVAALFIIIVLALADLAFYWQARRRWRASADPTQEVDPRFLGFIGKGIPKPPNSR